MKEDRLEPLLWLGVGIASTVQLLSDFTSRLFVSFVHGAPALDFTLNLIIIGAHLMPNLLNIASAINLVLALSICYTAVTRLPSAMASIPDFRSSWSRLVATVVLFLLYIRYSIPYGGYPAIAPQGPENGLLVYGVLVLIPFCLVFFVPVFRGQLTTWHSASRVTHGQVGVTLATAFLMSGGLAVLGSIEIGLAIVALLIAVVGMSNYEPDMIAEGEEVLMRKLQRIGTTPRAFTLAFEMVAGLFVIAETSDTLRNVWGFTMFSLRFVPPGIPRILAQLTVYVIPIAVVVIALVLLNFHQSTGGLLVGEWVIAVLSLGWQSEMGVSIHTLDNPVIYVSALSTAVFVVSEVQSRYGSSRASRFAIILAFAIFGPLDLQQDISTPGTFLTFTVLAMWGAPVIEQIAATLSQHTSTIVTNAE